MRQSYLSSFWVVPGMLLSFHMALKHPPAVLIHWYPLSDSHFVSSHCYLAFSSYYREILGLSKKVLREDFELQWWGAKGGKILGGSSLLNGWWKMIHLLYFKVPIVPQCIFTCGALRFFTVLVLTVSRSTCLSCTACLGFSNTVTWFFLVQ